MIADFYFSQKIQNFMSEDNICTGQFVSYDRVVVLSGDIIREMDIKRRMQ